MSETFYIVEPSDGCRLAKIREAILDRLRNLTLSDGKQIEVKSGVQPVKASNKIRLELMQGGISFLNTPPGHTKVRRQLILQLAVPAAMGDAVTDDALTVVIRALLCQRGVSGINTTAVTVGDFSVVSDPSSGQTDRVLETEIFYEAVIK